MKISVAFLHQKRSTCGGGISSPPHAARELGSTHCRGTMPLHNALPYERGPSATEEQCHSIPSYPEIRLPRGSQVAVLPPVMAPSPIATPACGSCPMDRLLRRVLGSALTARAFMRGCGRSSLEMTTARPPTCEMGVAQPKAQTAASGSSTRRRAEFAACWTFPAGAVHTHRACVA